MEGGDLDFEKPLLELERKIEELKRFTSEENIDLSQEIKKLEEKARKTKEEIYSNITPWQRTQIARHPRRPYTLDYCQLIFADFIELHGDRCFRDDRAIVGGIGRFEGQSIVVIGHQKGRNTKENLIRNFGMPHPEGYRKALRLMKLAEKFSLPVVTFIDTPGAYPGVGAEERGQAEAIARNLKEMARLETPILTFIIGEGGSGGALAIGMGNRILMLENAVYFVCTPEACGAILWRDRTKAPEAAKAMCITAQDLVGFGVVDEVVPEPLGGAHRDYQEAARQVKKALKRNLDELVQMDVSQIIQNRFEKFSKIGMFNKNGPPSPR